MESESQSCANTIHHPGCQCHEHAWENKWKIAVEMAALAELAREDYRDVASELIAAIRINTARGTFAAATIDQVDEWLEPWIAKLAPNPAVRKINNLPTELRDPAFEEAWAASRQNLYKPKEETMTRDKLITYVRHLKSMIRALQTNCAKLSKTIHP